MLKGGPSLFRFLQLVTPVHHAGWGFGQLIQSRAPHELSGPTTLMGLPCLPPLPRASLLLSCFRCGVAVVRAARLLRLVGLVGPWPVGVVRVLLRFPRVWLSAGFPFVLLLVCSGVGC